MKLTDKEINAILSKSQDVRYSYSLKRIADNNCLWVLATKEGNFISFHDKGLNMLPLWPFLRNMQRTISRHPTMKMDGRLLDLVLKNSQMS